MVEESWEVLKSPIIKDSLGLVIRSSHNVTYCSQSRRLYLNFSERRNHTNLIFINQSNTKTSTCVRVEGLVSVQLHCQ